MINSTLRLPTPLTQILHLDAILETKEAEKTEKAAGGIYTWTTADKSYEIYSYWKTNDY